MTLTADARPIVFDQLDELVGYQLRRAFLRSNQLFAEAAAQAGLAPGQVGVLKLVLLNPGRSQSEIAAAAGLDRSTLTPMLDQLGERGLIERRPGPNRRTVSLHATEEGQAVWRALEPHIQAHEREIRRNLTEAEGDLLLDLLKRLAA